MKIKTVTANNRKKVFEVATATDAYAFPYALLRVQPTSGNRIGRCIWRRSRWKYCAGVLG